MDVKNLNENIVLIGFKCSGVELLKDAISHLTTVPYPGINNGHRGPIIQHYIGHPTQQSTTLIKPTSKVVFVIRNIKDIAVVTYKNSNIAQSTRFGDFLLDRYMLGDSVEQWCDHIKQWQTTLASHPTSNLHLIYFTDLLKNFEEEVQKLSQFLQVNKGYQEITQLCSTLQGESDQPQRKRRKTDSNNVTCDMFYECSVWKKYFTVNQQEQIDSVITNLLQSTKLDMNKLLS